MSVNYFLGKNNKYNSLANKKFLQINNIKPSIYGKSFNNNYDNEPTIQMCKGINKFNLFPEYKYFSSVTDFLNNKGFYSFEGYSQQIQQQVEDLINLTSRPNINVMEIGFNAGHSSEIFLKNNNNLFLTSFDLGTHDYVKYAKKYIDTNYSNRHTLILGNSTMTIPEFIKNNNVKFDIIFIDGGHEYETANKDIENCYYLSHEDTIIILDDTIYINEWQKNHNIGPTKAWIEHIEQNKIIELNRKQYCIGRGMSWGKYVKN
jgi:predicted O-methyltransferase YrrM